MTTTNHNSAETLKQIKSGIVDVLVHLRFNRSLSVLGIDVDAHQALFENPSRSDNFPAALRDAEDQEDVFDRTFNFLCRSPFNETGMDILTSSLSMTRRFHEMALVATDALDSGVFPATESRWLARFIAECPRSFDPSSLQPDNAIHILGHKLPQVIVLQGQEQLEGLSEIGLKIRRDELQSVWEDPHFRASYGKALAWFQEDPKQDDEAFQILADATRHHSCDILVGFTLVQRYSDRISEPDDYLVHFGRRLDARSTLLFKAGFSLYATTYALSAAATSGKHQTGPYLELANHFSDLGCHTEAEKSIAIIDSTLEYENVMFDAFKIVTHFRSSIAKDKVNIAEGALDIMQQLIRYNDQENGGNETIEQGLRIIQAAMCAQLWIAKGEHRRAYHRAMAIENGIDHASYFSQVKLESYLRSADNSAIGIWREVAEETLEQWFGSPLVWQTLYEHSHTKPRIWSVVFRWLLEAIQRAPNYGALWDILADATKDSPFGQALAEDLAERRAWQKAQLQAALNKKTGAR